METTIFEKIKARQIPAEIVFENEYFFAFMDIHPRAPGHILVCPTHPYRWVWDLPSTGPDGIGAYFQVVQRLAQALQRAFGVELIRSQIYGEEVPHAHVWLWPDTTLGDPSDLTGNAAKIRNALTTT